MDLTCTPTPTKTPDSDNDTPPHTTQPLKPLSFINGKHHPLYHQQPPCTVVTYKECMKNHAASIGGHAVDGCGEFMPSSDFSQSNPTSLKCAACGCHRNFHRREPAEDHLSTTHFIDFRHHILPPIRRYSPSPSPSPPSQPQPVTPKAEFNSSGRKRFRTKFTQEQKDKMYTFSEKLGWKMQKCDDAMVDEFCNEVGVGKSVLRVWMHNNKNTFSKKDLQYTNHSDNNTDKNNINGFNINGSSSNEDHHNNNDDNNCGLQLHISTNGSCSSS